jgi:hypothetical protein
VYTPESRGFALLITEKKYVIFIDVYGNNKEYSY